MVSDWTQPSLQSFPSSLWETAARRRLYLWVFMEVPVGQGLLIMAEGVGFEPTEAGLTTSPAFEAGPFIRSGTPPRLCDQLQVPPILALSSRVPRGICFSPRLRASVVRQRLFFCFLCFLCSLTPATEAGKVIDQGEGRWIGNVLCGDFC